MNPIDYRNATWNDVKKNVTGLRAMVFTAWQVHGRGTTREVAEKAAIDILTFRPRTTELVQLGLVECISGSGNEGIYRALSLEEAHLLFAKRCREAAPNYQPEFAL